MSCMDRHQALVRYIQADPEIAALWEILGKSVERRPGTLGRIDLSITVMSESQPLRQMKLSKLLWVRVEIVFRAKSGSAWQYKCRLPRTFLLWSQTDLLDTMFGRLWLIARLLPPEPVLRRILHFTFFLFCFLVWSIFDPLSNFCLENQGVRVHSVYLGNQNFCLGKTSHQSFNVSSQKKKLENEVSFC